MQKVMFYVIVGISLAFLQAGCIPSEPTQEYDVEPAETVKSPEEMLEEWMAYAVAPDIKNPQSRPFSLTDQLAATGPTALAPCLDLLGKPETTSDTKVFILQCITVNMTPAYIPYIKPLLKSEDPITRSCSYSLLGNIMDPSVPGLLEEGLKDDDKRSVFSSMSGLAIHNVEPARSEFMAKYWDEKTTLNQKYEIIRVILKQPTVNELDILSDVLINANTNEKTRYLVAMILGRIGTSTEIEALQKSMEFTTNESYKEIIDSAEALIRERESDDSKG